MIDKQIKKQFGSWTAFAKFHERNPTNFKRTLFQNIEKINNWELRSKLLKRKRVMLVTKEITNKAKVYADSECKKSERYYEWMQAYMGYVAGYCAAKANEAKTSNERGKVCPDCKSEMYIQYNCPTKGCLYHSP
jgi:hypothetical protein